MQFVLIHSPFVGPLTWLPTARALEEQRQACCLPTCDITSAAPPYWPYLARRVAAVVDDTPSNEPLVLVAHSAAGLLLPAVRAALRGRAVRAYVFVDAALPRDGVTLAELIPPGAGVTVETLRAQAEGGLLAPWGSGWPAELWEALIPDAHLRARFVAEVPSVPLALYEELTPSVPGWPDGPCWFLRFSATVARTPGRASCWKIRSICSGGYGISASNHHLSRLRKAPARYRATTANGTGGESMSA